MKYYIIAGEASGDLHGSNLIKALKSVDQAAEVRCWGGDLMEKEGGRLVKHYRELAFMGFLEVAKNLKTILQNIALCKDDVSGFQPDALILIDYPGFNLRIAKWARPEGLKVFYYISPQLWAWHKSRVFDIKKTVDKMFVILPFEKAFYKKYEYDVDYVGHPLLDVVREWRPSEDFRIRNGLSDKPIIALTPGSRRQEVEKILPLMLSVVPYFENYQFVVAGAPGLPNEFYKNMLARHTQTGGAQPALVENQLYDLLQHTEAALTTSGTATLETALFDVPQVVCYKGSEVSYQIAKRIVDVKYISLVNLIAGKAIIPELIQSNLTTVRLIRELRALFDEKNRERIKEGYAELKALLGESGASQRIAGLIIKELKPLTV